MDGAIVASGTALSINWAVVGATPCPLASLTYDASCHSIKHACALLSKGSESNASRSQFKKASSNMRRKGASFKGGHRFLPPIFRKNAIAGFISQAQIAYKRRASVMTLLGSCHMELARFAHARATRTACFFYKAQALNSACKSVLRARRSSSLLMHQTSSKKCKVHQVSRPILAQLLGSTTVA